ncbi:TetR/AcrR family transcriptional regulator, partial [Undibacterium sp.]|uniref:TetR/AcrR family transcriptional regulator n=1 Tax=Undibacterium sp. TaxID=1914977 RepID=UPI002CC46962
GIRQFDEGAALQRVLEVFWQKGFGPTSMQDLAEATGVQRGSLYNAYGDKESLFLHVFEQYKNDILDEVRASLEQPRLEDALRAFFNFAITSMTTGKPTRGCLTTKTATDINAAGDKIREALQSLIAGMEAALEARLSTAEAIPQLRLLPAEAARLLVTLTRGIVVMERIYQDPARLRATAEAMIKTLIN